VRLRFSGRADGDLRVDGAPDPLAARRAALAPGPWTWLHQVHGAAVVVVSKPGEHAGADADAAVTAEPGAVLAVHTADCAPVLLADETRGVVGAAHAGWRGLAAGVIGNTVAAMAALGATDIRATLGPCIRVGCYEFGAADLDGVDRALAEAGVAAPGAVRGTTGWGRPALDLAGGVRAALAAAGIARVDEVGGCTACDPARWFSHRARREPARQASLIWIEP
jgi:polyphenol oxidase